MTKWRYNPTKTQRSARKEAASATKTQPSQKNKVVDAIRSIKGLSPKDQAIALLAASANQLTAAAIDKLSAKEARHSARAPQLSAAPAALSRTKDKLAGNSKGSLFDRITPRGKSLFDRIVPSTINRGGPEKN